MEQYRGSGGGGGGGGSKYTLVKDVEDQYGIYNKPLPCFGCGIGWFSFLLGFAFPPLWYYGIIMYLRNYYHKDPRERAGVAASAAAGMIFTIVATIILVVLRLSQTRTIQP